MVYPTQRAIFAMATGVPVTLLLAMFSPGLWAIGGAWIAALVTFMLLDFLMSAKPSAVTITPDVPKIMYIDDTVSAQFSVKIESGLLPRQMEMKVTPNALLTAAPETAQIDSANDGTYTGTWDMTTARRGDGRIEQFWARWLGPLGLVWIQTVRDVKIDVPIVPNSKYVTDQALRFYSQDAAFGQKLQRRRGEGTEFDSLRDFVAGMDKRAIDWKQSARHNSLKAKEYRTERNHNIIFALDTGRLMCEPLEGVPRIDRALNAALLMSYVCLKHGDRVGFFGFDAAPRVYAKPVAGLNSFAQLQRQTAKIDYSIEETNFTLGLSQLDRTLSRRSLIVMFTDFVDTTNAELMMENLSRLVKTHLVVFVTFNDTALEAYMTKRPDTPQDISRAVIAASLSQDREIVLARLRRLGVQIIEADIDTVGIALLNKFFDLKNRGMI